MSNYDFSTLSPLDFEILSCDLMNAYFNHIHTSSFQSFKAGRDKGIDLLLSTQENDYEIIGQVKHYVKSTFSNLKSDLKKTEKDKVFKLKPKEYLVITSLELSHQQKFEIKKIFEPYILTIDSIFGREDLNRILRSNKEIEEKHYKLWFSSTIVLNKLLNYKLQGRRKDFTDSVLKKKLRLFVITEDFYKAKFSLKKNKYIILTGEPGVGKSTLSDMLIYNYIMEDYELNIIYDDIKDIELNLLDDNSKQLFYFDDFLGHTQEEINKSKSTETALIRIISRIENLENKFLILNTRKFILTSFIESSERLRHFDPLRSETRIELTSYSYSTKRRMLENHINESMLEKKHIEIINSLAHKICSDKNFTPRLIEFFTSSKILKFTTKKYETFILDNLKNPKEIWSHAYNNQITIYDQFFLNTLYSLKGEETIEKLKLAYEYRLDYEVNVNNYIRPINSFEECLKRLNDGFIIINNDYNDQQVSFINHSLEDYLNHFIIENRQEVERILSSSIYINQWYLFYKPFVSRETDINQKLLEFFTDNYTRYISSTKSYNNYYQILIFSYYFSKNLNYRIIKELFDKIQNWEFLKQNFATHFYSKKFLLKVMNDSELYNLIISTDFNFFSISILNEENFEDLMEIYNLFKRHYELDFSKIASKDKLEKFNESVKTVFKLNIDNKYNFLKNINTEKDYHTEIIDNIDLGYNFIKDNIDQNYDYNYSFLKNQNWNQFAQNNLTESYLNSNLDEENISDYYQANNLFEEYTYREDLDISLDELIKRNNSNLSNKYLNVDKENLDDLPF